MICDCDQRYSVSDELRIIILFQNVLKQEEKEEEEEVSPGKQ